jgi:hypothetical protein
MLMDTLARASAQLDSFFKANPVAGLILLVLFLVAIGINVDLDREEFMTRIGARRR